MKSLSRLYIHDTTKAVGVVAAYYSHGGILRILPPMRVRVELATAYHPTPRGHERE
jgi:hypothetical protein